MTIKESAIYYHSLGISTVPVGKDKLPRKKETDIHEYGWKKHQSNLIYPNGLFDECYGIGIVCGFADIECIDIDCKYDLTGKLFDEYKKLINSLDKNLLSKLVVEKSVSGGYHFIYKCKKIEGNKKLANRYTTDTEKELKPNENILVLIETRGIGGYFACYPMIGYELVYKDFSKLEYITEDERQTLFDCAVTFNEVYDEPYVKKEYQELINNENSPFKDYNNRADILDLLQSEGWKVKLQRGKKTLLLRPGGTGKWSADWDSELRKFYVFTSSSQFESGKAFAPSAVLCTLKFGGNYSECAKWLLKNGYGGKPFISEDRRYTDYQFLTKNTYNIR